MKAAGATDAEIEALMLAHVRIDGWAILGFCWVTLIGSTAFRGVSAKDYGLSDHWNIIMSVAPMCIPVLCLGFLIRRAARNWIAHHESRLDCLIIPSIRCRASENTYEEYFYAWVALWIAQAILLSLNKTPSYAFIFGIAAFNGAVILGTMQWKTGSVRISAPVSWENEIFYPHQVKATAGSVVGQFQSQLGVYSWEEAKKERALARADRAALRARREGRRPK